MYLWDVELGTSNINGWLWPARIQFGELGNGDIYIYFWSHGMPCNGCRKSEKPTVTDVACTKEQSHLGKVGLLSSLTGGISGYAVESSSSFWGYLRWMPKEEYWIVYFLLFSGKIILKQKTENEETLFSTCPVYWSLVLYQHCSKIKE